MHCEDYVQQKEIHVNLDHYVQHKQKYVVIWDHSTLSRTESMDCGRQLHTSAKIHELRRQRTAEKIHGLPPLLRTAEENPWILLRLHTAAKNTWIVTTT